MRRQKRMTYFTSGYGLGAWIVPSIVAAPRYFRGELGLGGLMQTSQAFQQVQDALSFFVQSYKEIAAWCAVVERLAGFERALEHVRRQSSDGGVRRVEGRPTHLTVEGVDLHLPDGQPLMANINLSLAARGDRAPGGRVGLGKEHAHPCHRRHLAVRARRDPRAAGCPDPLSPAAAVPADRRAPRRGELSDARGRCGRPDPARGARGGGAPGARRAARRGRPLGAPALPRRAAAHRLRAGPGPEARLALSRRGDLGAGRGDGGAPLSAGARAAPGRR